MKMLLLPILLQSANPYGSPIPDILRPSEARAESEQAAEAETAPEPPTVAQRFDDCVDLAIDDTPAAINEANAWRIEGGGHLARHCLGFAYAQQGRWQPAAQAFTEAAREAELARDDRTARFWVQAGNAALAGGDAAAAIDHLTAALVTGTLAGQDKGLVHVDRARAYVAADNYAAAKQDFALARELAPKDPLGWLLSATLARREGDLVRAKADIEQAALLAPRDPAIALETGNIAYLAGDLPGAKLNWEQAVELDAGGLSGNAASRYLAQLVTTVDDGSATP